MIPLALRSLRERLLLRAPCLIRVFGTVVGDSGIAVSSHNDASIVDSNPKLRNWVEQRHFEEIDSTQSYVEREHTNFVQDRLTAVSADFQTSGRGTRNRTWLAARARSVLTTFYFRFPFKCTTAFVNRNAPSVTRVLSIAAVDVLQQAAGGCSALDERPIKFGVKWPNDIVVNGKKIGGILARAVPFNNRFEGIIIGIGININTPAADLSQIDRPVWPATSLYALTGEQQVFDVTEIRRQLAFGFAAELEVFFDQGFAAFRARVNKVEALIGTRVRLRLGEFPNISAEVDGVFEGVDSIGQIQIRFDDGDLRAYPSGEIIPRSSR